MTDGVLVVDKPAGMTSHDVVDEVRRRFRTRKVGHAGTLDPDATGVLVLGLGRATRFLTYSQHAPKRYTAVARFGITTTTQDASGEIVQERPAAVDAGAVAVALPALTGEIEQVPPMVSAVKVKGERLYKAARRGQEVERRPRRVTVYRFELNGFTPGPRPEAELDVLCSGGTYVRTLVHDLGEMLSCGAHLVSLRRTEAGGFSLSDAVALSDAGPDSLLPLSEAVRLLPRVVAGPETARRIEHGREIERVDEDIPSGGHLAFVTSDGDLLGVYRNEDGRIVADRVVSAAGGGS